MSDDVAMVLRLLKEVHGCVCEKSRGGADTGR